MATVDSTQSGEGPIQTGWDMQGFPDDYGDIVGAIRDWPISLRFTLAQLILRDLEMELRPRPNGQDAFDRLYGIARTNQPPPTDEEVEQWLDDHRMSKYG